MDRSLVETTQTCRSSQIDTLDAKASDEFMRGPAFAANPVGEEFDPEELATRFDAGEPVDDLVFRSDQPESRAASIMSTRNPFQRLLRDLMAMRNHPFSIPDPRATPYAKCLLGLPPEPYPPGSMALRGLRRGSAS